MRLYELESIPSRVKRPRLSLGEDTRKLEPGGGEGDLQRYDRMLGDTGGFQTRHVALGRSEAAAANRERLASSSE